MTAGGVSGRRTAPPPPRSLEGGLVAPVFFSPPGGRQLDEVVPADQGRHVSLVRSFARLLRGAHLRSTRVVCTIGQTLVCERGVKQKRSEARAGVQPCATEWTIPRR